MSTAYFGVVGYEEEVDCYVANAVFYVAGHSIEQRFEGANSFLLVLESAWLLAVHLNRVLQQNFALLMVQLL